MHLMFLSIWGCSEKGRSTIVSSVAYRDKSTLQVGVGHTSVFDIFRAQIDSDTTSMCFAPYKSS